VIANKLNNGKEALRKEQGLDGHLKSFITDPEIRKIYD
jgi:hypothetical protein